MQAAVWKTGGDTNFTKGHELGAWAVRMVAAGENRKIVRPMVNNQPMVLAKPVPPGWKRRLYGRQDARRYGGGGRMRRFGEARQVASCFLNMRGIKSAYPGEKILWKQQICRK